MLQLHLSQMLTFLNVRILDINCTYRMFEHRNCVITFTKITIFPYSEHVQDIEHYLQVLEMIRMLNELIQANEMVFMNFWYIEH